MNLFPRTAFLAEGFENGIIQKVSLSGGFLENENSLETLIVIFENVSPKGSFWLKVKYFEISVLTANSRYLQTVALNDSIQANFWPFTHGVTYLRKQYSYIWLPFQYHSTSVIWVCRISAAILGMLSVF